MCPAAGKGEPQVIDNITELQGSGCGTIDVAVIGDALIDYQYWVKNMPPVGGDEMISMSNKSSGGSAANSAIALGIQHIRTAFCGRVGSDENGQWIKDRMTASGVDISCMQYGESTGYVLSVIDKSSERTMLSFRGASAEPLVYTPELQQMLQSTKLLLISGYSLMNPRQASLSLTAAHETHMAGGLVALDTSPVIAQIAPDILNQMLDVTDIILPNKSELKAMTDAEDIAAGIEKLLARVPCIGLKLGSEGSMAAIRAGFVSPCGVTFIANTICRAAANRVIPIDTTGAGDAFNAGFIAALLQSAEPQRWIENGNELAAKVVSQKGASL